MQKWPIDSPSTAQVPAELARLALTAIGSGRFAHDILMGVRSQLLTSSYCSIFWIHPKDRARVIDVAGLEPDSSGATSARRYVESKYYGHDPLFTDMAGSSADAHLRLSSSSDISVDAYRSECYEMLGIHQRYSLVFPSTEGAWLALNFYRHRLDDEFSGRELDGLRSCGQLLEATVTRHLHLTQAMTSPSMKMQSLFAQAKLSRREEQVLRCALDGQSNKQIARTLGIEPNTVVTYRERAYRRLGLSRHADLVRLLVGTSDTEFEIFP